MSPRDWRDRVRDILDAIFEIQRFVHGMDYETFKNDDKSIHAVDKSQSTLDWLSFTLLQNPS